MARVEVGVHTLLLLGAAQAWRQAHQLRFHLLHYLAWEAVLEAETDMLDEVRAFHVREVVAVSYTHLRAHETVLDLVCRLLLEKKNSTTSH